MSLKTLALAFLNTAKDDVILDALPLFGATAANVAANPSELNAASQAAALQVNLLAKIPLLDVQLLQLVAAFVQETVQNAVTAATSDVQLQAAAIIAAVPLATVTAPAVAVAVPKGV